jgi:hypothetical protein
LIFVARAFVQVAFETLVSRPAASAEDSGSTAARNR